MLNKCVNLHDIRTQIATIGVKTLTSIIVQRVTTRPRRSLPFVVYNSAFFLPPSGARGGRGERAVGVATSKKISVKKKRTNVKSKQSKCCGLAISRRIQIYAMIAVELRTLGEIFVQS